MALADPRWHTTRVLRRRRPDPRLGHSDRPVPAHVGARGHRARHVRPLQPEREVRPRVDARRLRAAVELCGWPVREDVPGTPELQVLPERCIWCLRRGWDEDGPECFCCLWE